MNFFFSVIGFNFIIVFLNLMLDSMWKIVSSIIICVFICRIRFIMLNVSILYNYRINYDL